MYFYLNVGRWIHPGRILHKPLMSSYKQNAYPTWAALKFNLAINTDPTKPRHAQVLVGPLRQQNLRGKEWFYCMWVLGI